MSDEADRRPIGQMRMDQRFRIIEEWIDGLARQLQEAQSVINGLKQSVERLEQKGAIKP